MDPSSLLEQSSLGMYAVGVPGPPRGPQPSSASSSWQHGVENVTPPPSEQPEWLRDGKFTMEKLVEMFLGRIQKATPEPSLKGSHAWASHTSDRLHKYDDLYWLKRIQAEDPVLLTLLPDVEEWLCHIPYEWKVPENFHGPKERHINLFLFARNYQNLRAVTFEPDHYAHVIHGHEVAVHIGSG